MLTLIIRFYCKVLILTGEEAAQMQTGEGPDPTQQQLLKEVSQLQQECRPHKFKMCL